MALTHNGTKVSVAAALLPAAYTKPTVTEFTDHEFKYTSRSFSIVKSTVEEAVEATTMINIMTALNTLIETLLAADIDTTGLTVTSWADLKSLSTNNNLAGCLFTSVVLSYVLTVDIYVKTA